MDEILMIIDERILEVIKSEDVTNYEETLTRMEELIKLKEKIVNGKY